MTESVGSSAGETRALTLLDLAVLLVDSRRLIVGLALAGAVWGAAASLLSTRQYMSVASFVPEESAGAAGGLAATARQFGFALPGTNKGWSPGLYVEVLKSRQLLEAIVTDTVQVAELDGRRIALLDLFEIEGATPALRLARGIRHLDRQVIRVSESRNVGSVSVRASTPWPSVSQHLTSRLIARVGEFNVSTRQTQAAEEARYAETMTETAERELRSAENALLAFLQENRDIGGAPALQFRKDRLQREVTMRQELYSSIVMTRDEARLRRVRDTPVLSVLEAPTLPAIGESRGTVMRVLLMGIAGFVLAIGLVLARRVLFAAPSAPATAATFRATLSGVLPVWLRRRLGMPAPVP